MAQMQKQHAQNTGKSCSKCMLINAETLCSKCRNLRLAAKRCKMQKSHAQNAEKSIWQLTSWSLHDCSQLHTFTQLATGSNCVVANQIDNVLDTSCIKLCGVEVVCPRFSSNPKAEVFAGTLRPLCLAFSLKSHTTANCEVYNSFLFPSLTRVICQC